MRSVKYRVVYYSIVDNEDLIKYTFSPQSKIKYYYTRSIKKKKLSAFGTSFLKIITIGFSLYSFGQPLVPLFLTERSKWLSFSEKRSQKVTIYFKGPKTLITYLRD